jgi:hypothetical protein
MIYIRSLIGLQIACQSVGLVVMEKEGRLDFFVHVKPSTHIKQDDLEASYHIHVFPESNIAAVADGDIVSFRLGTILPKDGAGYGRQNLAEIEKVDEWADYCTQVATKEAARLFGAAVKTQLGRAAGAPKGGKADVFKQM